MERCQATACGTAITQARVRRAAGERPSRKGSLSGRIVCGEEQDPAGTSRSPRNTAPRVGQAALQGDHSRGSVHNRRLLSPWPCPGRPVPCGWIPRRRRRERQGSKLRKRGSAPRARTRSSTLETPVGRARIREQQRQPSPDGTRARYRRDHALSGHTPKQGHRRQTRTRSMGRSRPTTRNRISSVTPVKLISRKPFRVQYIDGSAVLDTNSAPLRCRTGLSATGR
jgi:hypothetical protein